MVPGFHLINRDFTFVANSTKYQRTHDLWREFLPWAGQLLSRGWWKLSLDRLPKKPVFLK